METGQDDKYEATACHECKHNGYLGCVVMCRKHSSLVKQRDELLIAAKYCDEWLAEGINREGVDEILKRIHKAIKNAEKGA